MVYKLLIAEQAEKQIEKAIAYVTEVLKNPKAAADILDDILHVYNTLEKDAASFAFCEDNYLRAKGYRKFSLYKHDYIVIYRVNEDIVYIAGFFHMLENYRMKL